MRKKEEKKRSFSVYKSLMFGNKKTYLYVRKRGYFSMVMPFILLVDKKAVFFPFSTGRKQKSALIHSYPQLLKVIPRSLWKTFKPCSHGQTDKDKTGIKVDKGGALWKKEDLYTVFLKQPVYKSCR